jgi:hypothetical protein
VMKSPPDRRRQIARELGLLSATEELTGLAADRALLAAAVDQDRLAELDRQLADG